MKAKIMIGEESVKEYEEFGTINENATIEEIEYETQSEIDFYIQGLFDGIGVDGYTIMSIDKEDEK